MPGYPTTWGATPYREQVRPETAAVVTRLERAGAVLAAKLSVGALAWGDVWFRATTKNPWNSDQGSSGSSAGPGAATAAGLVGFSIGTETWGSIISPSTRCGVTGLRPSTLRRQRDLVERARIPAKAAASRLATERPLTCYLQPPTASFLRPRSCSRYPEESMAGFQPQTWWDTLRRAHLVRVFAAR